MSEKNLQKRTYDQAVAKGMRAELAAVAHIDLQCRTLGADPTTHYDIVSKHLQRRQVTYVAGNRVRQTYTVRDGKNRAQCRTESAKNAQVSKVCVLQRHMREMDHLVRIYDTCKSRAHKKDVRKRARVLHFTHGVTLPYMFGGSKS